jgi:hypothetical protein
MNDLKGWKFSRHKGRMRLAQDVTVFAKTITGAKLKAMRMRVEGGVDSPDITYRFRKNVG